MMHHRILPSVLRVLARTPPICNHIMNPNRMMHLPVRCSHHLDTSFTKHQRQISSSTKDTQKGPGQKMNALTRRTAESSPIPRQESVPEVTIAANVKKQPVRQNQMTLYTEEGMVTMKRTASYAAIREMTSEEVLTLAARSYEELDKTHVALCMKRLSVLKRLINFEDGPEQHKAFVQTVSTDPRFQVLCAAVARKGPHLTASIALDMLRFMAMFNLDSTHLAIQVYLQLMKTHISDLALDQLVNLSGMMDRLTPTGQTLALQEGIRVLLKANWDVENPDVFNHKMKDVHNLKPWAKTTLMLMYGSSLGHTFHYRVLRSLWNDVQRDGKLRNGRFATRVLRTLAVAEAKHQDLELWCISTLEQKLQYLTPQDRIEVLDGLYKLHKYAPDMLDTIANHTLDEQPNIHDTLSILKYFTLQAHYHKPLLTELTRQLCQRQDELGEMGVDFILDTCHVLGDGRVTLPVQVSHSLSQALQTSLHPGAEITHATALEASLSLAMMQQSVPKVLLDRIAISENDHFSDSDMVTHNDKMSLLSSLIPSSINRKDLSHYHDDVKLEKSRESLRRVLEEIFDESRLEHGATSSTGLHLDSLVRLPGKTSTEKEQDATDTMDPVLSPHRVAVLVMPSRYFFRNTFQLRGFSHMYARLLQEEGYLVVIINQFYWAKMPASEQQSYLQQRVLEADSKQDLVMVGMH